MARHIIEPWVGILEDSEIESIVIRYILPKFNYAIGKLKVDPSNQDIAPLNSLFGWSDLVRHKLVASVLIDTGFLE